LPARPATTQAQSSAAAVLGDQALGFVMARLFKPRENRPINPAIPALSRAWTEPTVRSIDIKQN